VTYFIRPVDRDLMPKGQEWLFLREHDGGDVHFVIAADAGAVVLPKVALEAIIRDVCEHERIPLAEVS
jgi:hypothetical protein